MLAPNVLFAISLLLCRYNVCIMEQGTGHREDRGAMDLYPCLSTVPNSTLGLPWWPRHKAGTQCATSGTIEAAKDRENTPLWGGGG